MKKIIAALMLGSMLLIGFVSCQVYADDCSQVLVNKDGDVYDSDDPGTYTTDNPVSWDQPND